MTQTAGVRDRRAWLLATCLAVLLPGALQAQDFPSSPVTIVVPYGPGSYTDNVIRPLAVVLQKVLGQPIVIDNRAGANGIIGTQHAARAKPDGYTLLAGSTTTLAANAGLFKNLPYDPQQDFVPVAGVAATSMMFMVRSDHAAKDLTAFLSHAESQPEPLPVGHGSSSAQVALALLSKKSGVKFTAVPYKGTPQAITDLIGGQVPAAIVDVANGVPQIRSGKLRALAISGAARATSAPDVPTLAETWPGTQLVTWVGLVAPAGTSPAIVEKLSAAVGTAMASPELKEKFVTIATELDPASPEELGDRMRRDHTLWLDLMKSAGIQPQ